MADKVGPVQASILIPTRLSDLRRASAVELRLVLVTTTAWSAPYRDLARSASSTPARSIAPRLEYLHCRTHCSRLRTASTSAPSSPAPSMSRTSVKPRCHSARSVAWLNPRGPPSRSTWGDRNPVMSDPERVLVEGAQRSVVFFAAERHLAKTGT